MPIASTLRWSFLAFAGLLQAAGCSSAPAAEGVAAGGASAGMVVAPSSGASGAGGAAASGGAATAGPAAGAAGTAGEHANNGGAGGAVNGGAGGAVNGGAGGATAGNGGATASGSAAWTHTPFIMDTWFWNDMASTASAIATVKQSGFAGFALSADRTVTDYVSAAAQAPLPIVGIWTPAPLDGYPAGIVDSIAGTGGLVLLSLNGGGFATSDVAGDAKALELIGKVADECKQKGLPGVALYPHVGFWLERFSDAVRLASKAARGDVGVVFNQYHWMKGPEGGKDLEATLKSAEPFLKVVTINGSDLQASILPLGQGTYDVKPILQALAKLDFHGSVGLQGYGIGGDIGPKLQSSKQAFDALLAGLQ